MKRNKILIVDDNINLIKAINFTLKNENYKVLTFNNGKDALELLKNDNEIAVLLIDLNMPDFSGVEFLTEIKDFKRPLQRIVMTATEDILTPLIAQGLDVFSFLFKPFTDYSLRFTIESAFNKLELDNVKLWNESSLFVTETIHLIGNKISPIRRRIEEISKAFNKLWFDKIIDEETFQKVSRDIQIIKECAEQTYSIKSDLININCKKKEVNIIEIINVVVLENEKVNDHIKFHFNSPKETPFISADGLLLKRVFENIIRNSIHAIEDKFFINKKEDKGLILIETMIVDENKSFIVDIKDNGCGIEENDIYKVFLPFFTTKGADRGNGIGLYFCKRTIESLEGEIEIKESIIGQGTTFSIKLPLFISN